MIISTCLNNRSLNVSTSGVNPSRSCVRSLNSIDPGIFSNLILARRFRKITATEQKFPSVSTAKGTTTEDGDLPFSHALSWQRLYFRREIKYI